MYILSDERAVYVLFVHLFVYFADVNFCPFSLPLGVRDWLRFVTVALPADVNFCPFSLPLGVRD